MYSITDLTKGTLIEHDGAPYRVMESQHVKVGRGGAVMRTKLKHMLNGAALDVTFRGGASIAPARVERKGATYSYQEGSTYHFMDSQSFEDKLVGADAIGEFKNYITEGLEVTLSIYQDKVVGVELPIKLALKVATVEAGAKGDTATAALKEATLETGYQIKVPLFIKAGDSIRIDTRTGKYIERVS